MITTRSLLPDAFTACWIESKAHRFERLRFRASSARPSAALIVWRGWVGRSTYPVDWASAIDRCRRLSESGWQTTRVTPGPVVERAEASDRAVGTSPPAHGVTEQSGAGSGQYEARSM